MEDATIIMNGTDKGLVEYFEYAVGEKNLLCATNN